MLRSEGLRRKVMYTLEVVQPLDILMCRIDTAPECASENRMRRGEVVTCSVKEDKTTTIRSISLVAASLAVIFGFVG